MAKKLAYRRVLFKLSGEMLSGEGSPGINAERTWETAKALSEAVKLGVQVGVVIGGGNLFRELQGKDLGFRRSPSDYIGMLATLMNATALREAIVGQGTEARILTALDCPKVAESYTWQRAHEYLERGAVVLFCGGTGNPYFTTDTAAALRASEIEADVLLKATKVDGIYSKDPLQHPDAVRYDKLTYSQALAENLEVMDSTAVALCQANHLPVRVFHMELLQSGSVAKVLVGRSTGSLLVGEGET